MKKKNKWWKKQTVHVVKINADGYLKKSVRILNPSLLMTVPEKNYLTTQRMVSEVHLVLEEKGIEDDLVKSMEKLPHKHKNSTKKEDEMETSGDSKTFREHI
ncbi:Uncharacterized protein Rs2_28511 [Raphanus sativus]|nr:Uncharacterized protein Rs2_28511 [Raphanus sativus]